MAIDIRLWDAAVVVQQAIRGGVVAGSAVDVGPLLQSQDVHRWLAARSKALRMGREAYMGEKLEMENATGVTASSSPSCPAG